MKIYVDGKLENMLAETGTITTSSTQLILGSELNGTYYTGSLDEIRLFNVAKTQAQIRTDMFQGETLASSTGLVARYKCDEGTGTSLEDSSSNTNTGTLSSAFWAGAGNFDKGTSTLVMAKSGTANFNYLNDEDIYNFTINDNCTVDLNCLDASGGRLDIYGNLINNEVLRPTTTGTSGNATVGMHTGDKTLTITEATTGMASLYRFTLFHTSGTITVPFSYHKRIVCSGNGGTTVQGSTLRTTEEFEVQNGHTYNSSAATKEFKVMDLHNGSTVDFSGSLL